MRSTFRKIGADARVRSEDERDVNLAVTGALRRGDRRLHVGCTSQHTLAATIPENDAYLGAEITVVAAASVESRATA